MTEIDRREALRIVGAAALTASAVVGVPETVNAEPSPELLELYNEARTQALAVDFEKTFIKSQYADVFRRVVCERAECKDKDREQRINANLKARACFEQMRVDADHSSFIFHVPHEEVALGFSMVTGQVKAADVAGYIKGLVGVFKEYREYRAFDVFNNGWTYNANVQGDGQPLFSGHHPTEDDMWANVLSPTYLDEDGVQKAELVIRNGYVDDRNRKIVAHPRRLLVPVNLIDKAEKLARSNPQFANYKVIDYFTDNENWFLQTNIDGLVFSEFDPFMLTVSMNAQAGTVTVVGKEVNGFGYSDPRAVLGVGTQTEKSKALADRQRGVVPQMVGLA